MTSPTDAQIDDFSRRLVRTFEDNGSAHGDLRTLIATPDYAEQGVRFGVSIDGPNGAPSKSKLAAVMRKWRDEEGFALRQGRVSLRYVVEDPYGELSGHTVAYLSDTPELATKFLGLLDDAEEVLDVRGPAGLTVAEEAIAYVVSRMGEITDDFGHQTLEMRIELLRERMDEER